jgi:hypothetical protein
MHRHASEDELLRKALEALDAEEEEEMRAIQEGLDSLDRGDEGIPLDDAVKRLRQKYNIQTQQ